MFETKAAVSKRIGIIACEHRHDSLTDDGAAVEFRTHEVHRAAVHANAGLQRAVVRITICRMGNTKVSCIYILSLRL